MNRFSEAERTAIAQARAIASDIARPAAPEVDREARFPRRPVAALGDAGLLGALVPADLGGVGCSPASVVKMTTSLGQACASTAMIFAMHQVQVLSLVRHSLNQLFFREFLAAVVDRRLLIASATSEVGTHGDIRSSLAAVETRGGRCRLRKTCAVISYGADADAILITARKDDRAHPSNQVLILLRKGEYRLEQIGTWDTLGMRGTCSPPFVLEAEFEASSILPLPFREIAAQTLVPYGHIFWAAVWLGIAKDAVSVSRKVIQVDARRTPGTPPVASTALVRAAARLHDLRSLVSAAITDYEALEGGGPSARTASVAAAVGVNNLKIRASELACQICTECLVAAGLRAYTDAAPTGLGRHIRDVLSAPIMISNGRLAAINSTLLLIGDSDSD
jgi:acyl-CoA dehydrogenase